MKWLAAALEAVSITLFDTTNIEIGLNYNIFDPTLKGHNVLSPQIVLLFWERIHHIVKEGKTRIPIQREYAAFHAEHVHEIFPYMNSVTANKMLLLVDRIVRDNDTFEKFRPLPPASFVNRPPQPVHRKMMIRNRSSSPELVPAPSFRDPIHSITAAQPPPRSRVTDLVKGWTVDHSIAAAERVSDVLAGLGYDINEIFKYQYEGEPVAITRMKNKMVQLNEDADASE